jgi:hypothetical protein
MCIESGKISAEELLEEITLYGFFFIGFPF